MKDNKVRKLRKSISLTLLVIITFVIAIKAKHVQAAQVNNEIYKKAIEESIKDDVKKLTQCERAIGEGKLKIAFVGDSITEGCDLKDGKDSYVNVLVDKIKKELPNVEVEYKNFSLGARMIGNFLDESYKATKVESDHRLNFSRSWATEGRAWKDCVKDFKPDLVILAFGMNDAFALKNSEEMFHNNMKKFACEMENWIKTPDLVLVTTILPTKNKIIYNQSQDITNALANVTRTFAKENKYMVADANRLFQILRDGKDILATEEMKYEDEKKVEGFLNGSIEFHLSFNKGRKERLVDLLYRKNDLGSVILRLEENENHSCKVGLYFSDNKTIFEDNDDKGKNTIRVVKNTLGNHVVEIINENDDKLKPYKEVIIPAIKGNKPHKVRVEAEDTKHNIYIDDKLVFNINIYRKLTPGKIQIKAKDEKSILVKNMKVVEVKGKQGYPTYSEEVLLGRPRSGDGNGANHPSKFGHEVVYGEAFNGVIKALKEYINSNSLIN